MTEVTIIIPNYNGKKLLENCIKTLERQTCQEFKLLVIDNGSKDGSTDVTSESLYMEMVALPENTGFCGAVNLGFEMTTTPYAILLNNDTEAEPHFVEELLQGIRQSERIFPVARRCLILNRESCLTMRGISIRCRAGRLRVERADLPQIMENRRMFFLLWRSGHLPDVRVKTDWCDG